MGRYSVNRIKISGHNGDVQNTFYFQGGRTDKLAVVFPGLGYTCQMPLLYYSTLMLVDQGFDVLWVETNYGMNKEYLALNEEMKSEWIRKDAIAAWKSAMIKRNYKRVVFLGKSIGTVSLAALLQERSLPKDTRNVLLTPLLDNKRIIATLQQNPTKKSIFVIGTADAYYDPDALKRMRENARNRVLVIKGADHSLEIGENVSASIKVLEKTLKAIGEFVSGR